MFDRVRQYIADQRETVIALQRNLVSIPALGPDNDGQGEWDKADYLMAHLKELQVPEILEFHAPDDRVPGGLRPNFGAVLPGKNRDKTLWVISHTDIVPPGDPKLWETDPYELSVDGDFVIGRGTEDNHQGLVSSLLVMKSLIDLNITPSINYGVLMVADEETASKFGLEYVLENHKDAFAPDDLFLVPDFGEPSSQMVEVAEKSMLWLKVTVHGKQCHGSTPQEGNNSLVAAADHILKIRRLYQEFTTTNDLFHPPHSTFEPTKKEANVPNINTIPGTDVFYVDCRILPEDDPEKVLETIRNYARETEKDYQVRIEVEKVQEGMATDPTPVDSEIVTRVLDGIRNVYGVEGKPLGIGGGTVAAFLRRHHFQAVVWSTLIHNAHQPNERSSISKTIKDAQVMAHMALK